MNYSLRISFIEQCRNPFKLPPSLCEPYACRIGKVLRKQRNPHTARRTTYPGRIGRNGGTKYKGC